MPKSPKTRTRVRSQKIGLWNMVRDVLVTSLNKGQFPLAMVGMIFIVMLVKMPGEDVSKLANKLLDELYGYTLPGYVLAAAALFGWALHTRWQRQRWTKEMDRITDERNQLQQRVLGQPMESSDR